MKGLSLKIVEREDYSQLTKWIVQVSQKPEQHCLHSWSGEDPESLCERFLSYLDGGELVYYAVLAEKKIVGSMGCEYDESLGRGWLHGPHLVQPTNYQTARTLFDKVCLALPESVNQLDAFLNVNFISGRQFYMRQGFKESETLAYEYWLIPADRADFDGKRFQPISPMETASFLRLFDNLFPRAYYSGERILKMIGDTHQVIVATNRDEVVGLVVTSMESGPVCGEIQFLGVKNDYRAQGIGRMLLTSAIDWLFDLEKVSRVSLNVSEERENAKSLYESCGFKLRFTGIGLEKSGEVN